MTHSGNKTVRRGEAKHFSRPASLRQTNNTTTTTTTKGGEKKTQNKTNKQKPPTKPHTQTTTKQNKDMPHDFLAADVKTKPHLPLQPQRPVLALWLQA